VPESVGTKPPPKPQSLQSEPAAVGKPRDFRVTIRTPSDKTPGDAGHIEEARFLEFSDGSVEVKDSRGRPVGVAQIKPGDDPEAAARKLLREKHGKLGAFHDPLRRPRWVV
jgi:hypothetical protein